MIFLSHRPSSYPTQPFFRYCGAYQIAAVASAHGKHIHDPREFFLGVPRISGFCLPNYLFSRMRDLSYDVNMMEGGGIATLKELLAQNKVVILCLGRAYDKSGKGFNLLKATCFQHYISVRGYDSVRDGFWVYDSSMPQVHVGVPVGNLFLSTAAIIKCRSRGGLGFYNNLFIAVNLPK